MTKREYTKDELALIYFNEVQLGKKKIEELLAIFDSPYKALLGVYEGKATKIVGDKFEIDKEITLDQTLNNIALYLNNVQIGATTICSKDFPKQLNGVEPAVFVLYYVGDISLASNKYLLGAVGTRKPSRYGRSVTQKFVSELVRAGIVPVSGLAYGIDSEVARTTLTNRGKTIAVLGHGLKTIYPASNTLLAKQIVENGGLLLSEYWPTVKPSQYTFPERNRIISGLSRGVLILEAGLNSGSLITATCAIDQGRELFVVPGNIDSEMSKGSNKLIEELPYTFTSSTENILNAYNLNKTQEENKNSVQLSIKEQQVVEKIKIEPKTIDELCLELSMDTQSLNILLTEMELCGIIKKLPGNYYGI